MTHPREDAAKEGQSKPVPDLKALRSAAELPLSGRMVHFPAQFRYQIVERNGKHFYELTGYATTFNQPYVMYDMFGEYTEEVHNEALDKSLAAHPDTAFLVNHRGVTMARTTNDTLHIDADPHGLSVHAFLNAGREDVKLLMSAIDDELVDQMSFAFMLNMGEWNEDYTHFVIQEADINRGDVSAVNFGANPYTSIAARSKEWMTELTSMPSSVQRAAYVKIEHSLSGAQTAFRAREDAYRAMGDLDPDDQANALIAAIDAALDEASTLVAGIDTSTLPPEVGQALGLLTAAEVSADELMELQGINDPDDPASAEEMSAPEKEQRDDDTSEPAAPLSRSVALYRNRLMLEEQD